MDSMTVLTIPLRETYTENQLLDLPAGSTIVGLRKVMQGRYEAIVFAPCDDRGGWYTSSRWVRLLGTDQPVPAFHEPRYVASKGQVHLIELTEPF
jgi:hypothetical protein